MSIHLDQGGVVFKCNIGCFSSKKADKHQPDAVVNFIKLAKGYYHCHHLSSYRHRLLNLPGTQRTTGRWQNVGRSIDSALMGQAGTKHPVYIYIYICVCVCVYSGSSHVSTVNIQRKNPEMKSLLGKALRITAVIPDAHVEFFTGGV